MAKNSIGMVQRITGPVVDIIFKEDEVPDIFNAITVNVMGKVSTLEVSQDLGKGEVRCISMSPTDGMSRGMEAIDTGETIKIGVFSTCFSSRKILSLFFSTTGVSSLASI